MSSLVSPGVDVQIIDESFYGSTGPGTVPLIVIATASNKVSPTGTGVAPYTVPSQANTLFLATSQRELIQNFGTPYFATVQGTPMHGNETNEYGLLAAYQFLGISNRAYVIRADIDLGQLEPSDSAPRGNAVSGTYWFDLSETEFGIFQSNGSAIPGSAWEYQPVSVAMENDVVDMSGILTPISGFGQNGDFAVVPLQSTNYLFEKISGSWLRVGTAAWKAARPTTVTGIANPPAVTIGDSIEINGTNVVFTGTSATDVANDINGASIANISASIGNDALIIQNTAGGNITLVNTNGTPLSTLGMDEDTYKGVEVFWTNNASYPSGSVPGDVWVKGSQPNNGADWLVKQFNGNTGQWVSITTPHYPFNSLLSDGNAAKDSAAITAMGSPLAGTLYVGYDSSTGVQSIRRWSGSIWETLVYEADFAEPSTDPEDGTLWFSNDFKVDIMYGDGDQWVGYGRKYPNTDPDGVIISGSAPLTQTDGTSLVDYDLWLDSSDTENYPALYRYNASTLRWALIDNTDQTSPFGIIFADARENTGVSFTGIPNSGAYAFESTENSELLLSDWVDPDAPDPRLYPDGMLLFNTRIGTNNVKEWRSNWFMDGEYDENTNYTLVDYTVGTPLYTFPALSSAGRWVTTSGNKSNGAMYGGRKAQRAVIVRAMAATLASNEDLRSEIVYFNLMAAPGYPELVDEMISLNTEQKEVAFIVADTPIRLRPDATSIQNWATNANLATSNGEDGLTAANEYVGVYYPWGISTNLDGSEVMVPPSSIALRTYAYNDQVAYPWLAPAGYQRGLVTNATSVGYLTEEDEFNAIILNQGQRDVLYLNKINPIAFMPNRGLVIYGQKTLSPVESALDRVNVARLANYLNYNLENVLKPFLFEPNDEQTRDAARISTERFMTSLVNLRAVDDFAVLCDITNNTAERRDRNELWVDVLVRPLKAIEFIYVPVRIRPQGDDDLEF